MECCLSRSASQCCPLQSSIRLLFVGHCSDGVTGQPTQGLQFVLGTQEQQEIFDTIVMANLVSSVSIVDSDFLLYDGALVGVYV